MRYSPVCVEWAFSEVRIAPVPDLAIEALRISVPAADGKTVYGKYKSACLRAMTRGFLRGE